MKVGILTWYDVLNYGSAFQAYALQELVRENGHEAEILTHDRKLPDYYKNKLKSKNLKGVLRWLRSQTPNRIKFRRATKQKYNNFVDFRNKNLNIGAHYSKTTADVTIIGSDQIFDINGLYYPFQFGKGISCSSISTYAPSFGETTLESLKTSPNYTEICDSIRNMNSVNARDKNTQEILSDICKKDIDIVLDPTLLYTFEKEKAKWNKRLINERYCVIYTWGGATVESGFAEQCRIFARKNNLRLVSVGEIRNWCDIQFASASPVEFFELFMHADMVLTNMFHGTCFSILMGRPFYSFVMPHNKNKLAGLLNFLNLQEQIISNYNDLPMAIPNLNYDKINSILSEKRQVSNFNLSNSLTK